VVEGVAAAAGKIDPCVVEGLGGRRDRERRRPARKAWEGPRPFAAVGVAREPGGPPAWTPAAPSELVVVDGGGDAAGELGELPAVLLRERSKKREERRLSFFVFF